MTTTKKSRNQTTSIVDIKHDPTITNRPISRSNQQSNRKSTKKDHQKGPPKRTTNHYNQSLQPIITTNHFRQPPVSGETHLPQSFDVLGCFFFHFRDANATSPEQSLGFHLTQLVQMVKHGCATRENCGGSGAGELKS